MARPPATENDIVYEMEGSLVDVLNTAYHEGLASYITDSSTIQRVYKAIGGDAYFWQPQAKVVSGTSTIVYMPQNVGATTINGTLTLKESGGSGTVSMTATAPNRLNVAGTISHLDGVNPTDSVNKQQLDTKMSIATYDSTANGRVDNADYDSTPDPVSTADNMQLALIQHGSIIGFLNTAMPGHMADTTIHFTQTAIDHAVILNRGTNSHTAIDSHLGDSTVHFTQSTINHNVILNRGTNSHTAIDTHIASTGALGLHNPLNDGAATSTNLWSASKIEDGLDDKENDLGSPTVNGYMLTSTTAGVRSWVAPTASGTGLQNTTGWLKGGQITINAGDDTKIDITAGSVNVVDYSDPENQVVTKISWPAQTVQTSLTARTSWVAVKDNGSGGAEFVIDTRFDSVERRTHAIIGKIRSNTVDGHLTHVDDFERPCWGLTTAFQDFILEFGSINLEGHEVTANASMQVTIGSGRSYRYHAEDVVGKENVHDDPAFTPRTSYAYAIDGSGTPTSRSTLDPDNYSLSGVKTALANNKYSRQEIRQFPVSGSVYIIYGKEQFDNLADAEEAGSPSVTAQVTKDLLDGSFNGGSIIMKKGTTNLATAIAAGTAKILAPGTAGGTSGGGFTPTNRLNIVFVGKHGNDTNSGLTPDKAKLTFGNAITYANTQTPSSTNRFAIFCDDAGDYAESLTISSWCGVYAPNAKITGHHTAADNSLIHAFRLICTTTHDAVLKNSGTGSAVVDCPRIILSGGASGITCTAGSITAQGDSIEVGGTGWGIGSLGTGGVVYSRVNHINIAGVGYGIAVSGTGQVRHSGTSISDGGSGRAIYLVGNGEADVNVSRISCGHAYYVDSATAKLHLSCAHMEGTKYNNGGTVNYISCNSGADIVGAVTLRNTLLLPAMTTGSVPFIGAGGLVSQDNSRLHWDNTTKKLGINTIPGATDARVTIGTPSGGAENALCFKEGSACAFHVWADFAGYGNTGNWITLRDWNGNNITTWRGDGNFGVNNQAPIAKLDVLGSYKLPMATWALDNILISNSQHQIYVDESAGNTPRIKFKNSTGVVVDRPLDDGSAGSTIIAYWDGRNDPSTSGGGYNQAVMAGNASYDAVNDLVELTENIGGQNGTLSWSLNQGAGFKAVAEFRISSAAGADAMYFYTHSNSVPTSEDVAVGGYMIAIDEWQGELQLKYNGVSLATHTGEAWADNQWHRLEVIINYNMITVAIDGVSHIVYQDVNGRNLNGQIVGFGARTGGSANKHDVRRLELYKSNNDGIFLNAASTEVYTSKNFKTAGRMHIGGTSSSVQDAKVMVRGTNGHADGPHVATITPADNYPLTYQLNWTHDNINWCFDAYYDGGFKSSDAGSNFRIQKWDDHFSIDYDEGIALGVAVPFHTGIKLGKTGQIDMPGIYVETTTEAPNVYVASDGSLRRSTASASGTTLYSGNGTVGAGRTVAITDTLNFDSNTLVIDGTNNRVGIGTNSPLVTFDVNGSTRIKGTATSVLTGSIDPIASTTVTGVGTLFTTELVKGDRITVTGETRMVTAIASNTSLTVDVAFTDSDNDPSPDRLPAELTVVDSSGNLEMVVQDDGKLKLLKGLAVDTWSTPTLGSAYSNASGYRGARYRKNSGNMLKLEGVLRTTTAHSQGTLYTMFTLPTGSRPGAKVPFMTHCTIEGSPATTPVFALLIVDTDGTVDIQPISGSLTVGQNWNIPLACVCFGTD